MADISTYINPENGDYVLLNGTILNNNSLLAEIYFRLNTPLGSYIYDKTLGNKLLMINYVPNTTTILQSISNALSPLTQSKRLINVNIQLVVQLGNSYTVNITGQDNTGKPIEFKWRKV